MWKGRGDGGWGMREAKALPLFRILSSWTLLARGVRVHELKHVERSGRPGLPAKDRTRQEEHR